MKHNGTDFDSIDRAILELLQEDCKQPLAGIGAKVGLSAPTVAERIHKLEEAGVITGYTALLDARKLGMDITAFIGVSSRQPRPVGALEREVAAIEGVLECHHVTGAYTLIVKVKTHDTETLEALIDRLRSLDSVHGTETMVVLSTHAERLRVPLPAGVEFDTRPPRRAGGGSRSRRPAR